MSDYWSSPIGSTIRRQDAVVRVDASVASLTVVVESPLAIAQLEMPAPAAGYGGHELVLSPNEEHLALFLYSGQSEVGYELFGFTPALSHVASLPYESGMADAPVFSRDSRWLAFAWTTNSSLLIDDDTLLDAAGNTTRPCSIEWARIAVLEITTGTTTACAVSVRLPRGSPSERDESWIPEIVSVGDTATLHLRAPWGQRVHIAHPPTAVTIDGPTTRPAGPR